MESKPRLNFVDRRLIRQCIHCGLCLPTCPTYQVLGSELDSPRGRIYQMKALADGRISPDDENLRRHIDLCLDCRACETACPSGVNYGQLLEHTRELIRPGRNSKNSKTETVARELVLNRTFTSGPLLDAAGLALRTYQKTGLQRVIRQTGLLKRVSPRLGELEQMLPEMQGGVGRSSVPRFVRARGKRRYRVAFLSGCVAAQIFGGTNQATVRVLVANGCDVITPDGQGCCGALHVHTGDRKTARDLARRNIAVFEEAGADYSIVNAAGCGSTLKEYGLLLADEPEWAERAGEFSGRVRDVTEFLASIDLVPPTGELHKRVTYQDACHLAHGQRIREQPRQLLRQIPGLELVEMAGSDTCCGSAGIYNVVNHDVSMQILERKIESVLATKADILAAANPGCIIQLMHGLRKRGVAMEVAHPIDLLDRAYHLT
ncbi:MAG: (Fe-S)-binding protein [Chloroflexi bacterium]|nr:(Fe-S)-binding protein [Chloroflexota bacterium]